MMYGFPFHFLNTSAFKLNLWKVEKDENHQFIGNLLWYKLH